MSRCCDCRLYQKITVDAGTCNKSPPRVFLVPVRTMQGDGVGFQSIYPQVAHDNWCGEHVAVGFFEFDEVKQ